MNFFDKQIGIRVVVFIVCSLSILGSLLIILTYCCFRSLRTNVRLILLHLSIMDMGIGMANLIGTAVYFDRFFYQVPYNNITKHWHNAYDVDLLAQHDSSSTMFKLCETQAFFALYSTYGSVFWTNCLVLYLYFAVVHHNTHRAKWMFWFSCIFCYGMPLFLSVWLLISRRLGSSPYDSGGWCTIISIDPITNIKHYFVVSFGYDMWIYLTFILMPVLFVGIRTHISIELRRSKNFISPQKYWSAVHKVDYKFLLIPLAFIFLRMWTCIIIIMSVYTNIMKNMKNQTIVEALVYLSAIGDSGQGLANGIIFVFFTKKVREKIFPCCKKHKHTAEERGPLNVKKTYKGHFTSIRTPPPSPPTSVSYTG